MAQRIEHRRPILPEPEVPDPGRPDRLRAKAGLLIQQEIAAAKRAARAESRAQSARAIAGTAGGAVAARVTGQLIPTEEAGVTLTWHADAYLIDHCRATGVLNWRQCEAGEELARARGLCMPRPWAKGGGPDAVPDDIRAAAAARYAELLQTAPHRCRQALATFAMGEWPVVPGMPSVLRDGLTAVADHLRLPLD